MGVRTRTGATGLREGTGLWPLSAVCEALRDRSHAWYVRGKQTHWLACGTPPLMGVQFRLLEADPGALRHLAWCLQARAAVVAALGGDHGVWRKTRGVR